MPAANKGERGGFGSRKRLVAVGLVLVAVVVLTIAFMAVSNLAFSLFDRLQSWSPWVAGAYAILLLFAAGASGMVVWRFVSPPSPDDARGQEPPSEEKIREALSRHEEKGVEVGAARLELRELDRRRETGEIYLALFGEISHGKTSLIRALVPDAEGEVDVRGGTTTRVRHYTWTAQSGDRVILADVPGMNLAGEKRQVSAMEEALRAHIVIFVCDGDLTADQWATLLELKRYGKPLIVAINKMDRLDPRDLQLVKKRIAERVGAGPPVVSIRSGGTEEVIRVYPDGREEKVERPRKPQVDALIVALQGLLMEQSEQLSRLRDNAIFLLASGKLDDALDGYREQTAAMLVERYTKRAVVGGLAAIAPGTDLLIQGALGAALIRSMTRLYDVKVRQVDLEALLKSASKTVATKLPLVLAVAGNALKAFPGIGTVAGGLVHAVAYGLIFQSMGKALARTLKEDGTLKQNKTIEAFEEDLNGNLAARAKDLALMAISQRGARSGSGG